jgi:SAM-dependent methyltransferase
MAAGLGLEATGVDTSPIAIDMARAKADQRGLPVRFLVGDALQFGVLGEHFDTVVDSGLYHVFDDAARAASAMDRVTPSRQKRWTGKLVHCGTAGWSAPWWQPFSTGDEPKRARLLPLPAHRECLRTIYQGK